MHLKICLVFLCLLLCQLQHVSSLRTRGMWSMSLMSMVSSGDSDASSNAAISITSDVTASSVPDGVVCEDGICTLPSSTTKVSIEDEHVTPETFNLYPAVDEESVEELMKMGWTKEDSTTALKKTKNDITAAAEWLQEEQDKEEAFEASVQNITAMGWVADMARAALNETDGNVTEALSILQLEEDNIVSNFEVAVQDMLQNGWEEIVARQALLAQWTLDQRKSLGFNDTFTREHLDKIRPTLKQNNDSRQSLNKELDNDSKAVPDDAAAAASTTAKKTKDASKKKAEPKPAKKEDVVFEVTAATFQKVVLESPVPVLLDVYADWCGPCKQLGPMLEEAAIRAGGMFRLAKLNSDNERSVVECLEVPGLPTVFAVVKGKINDR